MTEFNCRDTCRFVQACSLPGKNQDPEECEMQWKLEDYWHDAETLGDARERMEMDDYLYDRCIDDSEYLFDEDIEDAIAAEEAI